MVRQRRLLYTTHPLPKQSRRLTILPLFSLRPWLKVPDIAHSVTNPHTGSDSKGLESEEPDDKRKKEKPTETPPRGADTNDPNSNPTAENHPPQELELIQDNPKPNTPPNQGNKQSLYNPSHSRSQTYGGRTQGDQQPPHSATASSFPHHSSNNNPSPPNSRNPRSSDLRQSSGMHPSGLGPAPKSAGYEKHHRNHSSPPGVGSATRQPRSTRPVLTVNGLNLVARSLGSTTGDVLGRSARSLGSTPGSPKKDPPVPPPAS
jgi:hypothetical protein